MKSDSHINSYFENKLDVLSGTIVKRINFPKVPAGKMTRHASLNAKLRPMLSACDQDDVRGIVATVLTVNDALYRPLTFDDWKALFRAVRSELRIDRQSKNRSEVVHLDTLTDSEIGLLSLSNGIAKSDLCQAKRDILARRFRYLRSQIFAAFNADTTRKRRANLQKKLSFARYLLAASGDNRLGTIAFTDGESNTQAERKALQRFQAYIKTGEQILTDASLQGAHRVLKSFADLTPNGAI